MVLEQVTQAAVEAGRLIEQVRARGGVRAEAKADRSLVTEADHAADAFLRRRLPGVMAAGWLSEETADTPERHTAERLWVVDPLDGTREFLRGLPEYGVAVALVERGEPVLGVVHNPATGETVVAERGSGAWCGGARLSVAEGDLLLVSRTEVELGEFAPFDGQGWRQQATGSIQYKLAQVARGQAALTLSRGPKHEWDVCAGALLVHEAGGVATDLFGGPLRYNQPFPKVRGILAGAPEAAARAARIIARVGGSSRMNEFDHLATRGAGR
jgi:myo-inositol-1(or 4)-monophosphatase